MIRKLLRRVFRRDPVTATALRSIEPAIIPVAQHGITRDRISPASRRVCGTLQEAGFKAFVVGGAVRDLIAGITPNDYDVATDSASCSAARASSAAASASCM